MAAYRSNRGYYHRYAQSARYAQSGTKRKGKSSAASGIAAALISALVVGVFGFLFYIALKPAAENTENAVLYSNQEGSRIAAEIKRRILHGETEIPLDKKLSEGAFCRIISEHLSEDEDWFWMTLVQDNTGENTVVRVESRFADIAPENGHEAMQTLHDEMRTMLRGAAAQQTDLDKIRYVHDYLCAQAAYSYSGAETDVYGLWAYPYGCMVQHEATCIGYANTFYAAMQELGIRADIIHGTSFHSDGTSGGHAWNSVELEGQTYYVDVTWDDRENGSPISYDYYMATDPTFGGNHLASDTALSVAGGSYAPRIRYLAP